MLALLVGLVIVAAVPVDLHRLPLIPLSTAKTKAMSRFFGQIRQAGYVVPDIEAAMDYWSRVLGVGPFFYNPKVPIKNYRYKGEQYEPHNSVALANSGPLQIEQSSAATVPSMYKDFTDAGHTGLQHVAYWTSGYDADMERLLAEGFKPVMSGEVGERGPLRLFRYPYLHPGTVIELSGVAGPRSECSAGSARRRTTGTARTRCSRRIWANCKFGFRSLRKESRHSGQAAKAAPLPESIVGVQCLSMDSALRSLAAGMTR